MQEEIKELENKISNCFYENLQIQLRIEYLKRNKQENGNTEKTINTRCWEYNDMDFRF